MGFSTYTCFPAVAATVAIGASASWLVAMMNASTS